MVNVIRTRLDDGTVAIVPTTADDLDIAVDERHITDAAATAIALGLAGAINACDRAPRQAPDDITRTQPTP